MKAADASTFNEGVILFRLCPSTVLVVLRRHVGKVDLGAEPRVTLDHYYSGQPRSGLAGDRSRRTRQEIRYLSRCYKSTNIPSI